MKSTKGMTNDEYIEAILKKPRATWFVSSVSLSTLKRSEPRLVGGYVVGRKGKDRLRLVEDGELTDAYAVARLALASGPRRLQGSIIRPVTDVTYSRKMG